MSSEIPKEKKSSLKKKTSSSLKKTKIASDKVLNPQHSNREYVKHRIDCKCILPQYKNITPPIFHKFVVFSVLDSMGNVEPSYVQCNNCGVIHKVTEVGISKLLNKEEMPAMKKIEDIKLSLPPKLVGILELADVPLPSWQEAEFIIENALWGRPVILNKDVDGTNVLGKYVILLGTNLFKIETFEKETETEDLISG